MFTYLAINLSISFNAFDLMNHYIQKCFDEIFNLSSCKVAAIAKGVFATKAEQNLKSEIIQASFFTVHFDGSTAHNKKSVDRKRLANVL